MSSEKANVWSAVNPVDDEGNQLYDRKIKQASDGSQDVNVQDQTTPPIDFFFLQINGAPTTLFSDPVVGLRQVAVNDATNFNTGDYFGMFNAEQNRYYFGEILNVAGITITLDTPIDFQYVAGDTAASFERNLNADGSLTPQIFQVEVGPNATSAIDITRIMISFITATAVSLEKFGDLAKLTNGCVLRRVDGETRNIFNVKDNGEIANLCFDYSPYSASNPQQGQDGAKFRYTFAGQDKHGVAVRLNPGDKLQWVIQDDLTGLTQFRVIAEGHIVD